MSDIFLSYSRDDQAIARRFAEAFEREGLTVWWDQTLKPGEAYDRVTERALQDAKAVVVLWSKKSVESHWVRSEATQAQSNGTLVPVMIEPCKRPIMFELMHTAELGQWKGDAGDPAWKSFLGGVRQFVKKEVPTASPSTILPTPRKGGIGVRSIAEIVVAALLISGLVLWGQKYNYVFQATTQHATDIPKAPTAPTSVSRPIETPEKRAPEASIAVMPFANNTGDPDKEYVGDAMADELISNLVKVSGLHVASRTSSFAYKGRNADVRQIARDLNVRGVLEGAVTGAGKHIHVSAQLTDAESGYIQWSESYDRKYSDFFKLQDDLASEIVTAFRKNLDDTLPQYTPSAPPTKNLKALEYYQRGMIARTRGGVAGYREALKLSTQAINLDPAFTRAYWLRCMSRMSIGINTLDRYQYLDDVEHDARTILTIGGTDNVAALTILAGVDARRGNWISAESAFQELRAKAANDPDFHNQYAIGLLAPTGQTRRQLNEVLEAHRLAPAMSVYIGNLAGIYLRLGSGAKATEYQRLAAELGESAESTSALIRGTGISILLGKYGEAADLTNQTLSEQAKEAGGVGVVHGVFAALSDPSKRESAIAGVQSLTSKVGAHGVAFPMTVVTWFTLLGAIDQAYDAANGLTDHYHEQAFASLTPGLWSPQMRPFRRDPRFQAFVTRMGLMDYWNKYGPPDECDLKDGKLTCH